MEKKKIEHLIKNLKNHKDAVIFFGNRSNLNLFKINELTKENYNRKEMIKNPSEFWKYYKENIYDQEEIKNPSDIDLAINDFLKKGFVKLLINLNYTNHIKNVEVINLKGTANILKCMSCGKEINVTDSLLDELISNNKVFKCNECGGKISPTVLMFDEKYKENYINKIKNALFKEDEKFKVHLNTHTLIFIDIDFQEDYLDEIIESYSAIKIDNNSDEEYYTVMICNKDGLSIDYYRPEFATYENISDSIVRLNNLFKE